MVHRPLKHTRTHTHTNLVSESAALHQHCALDYVTDDLTKEKKSEWTKIDTVFLTLFYKKSTDFPKTFHAVRFKKKVRSNK